MRDERRRQLSTTHLLTWLERWRELGLVGSTESHWSVALSAMHPLAEEMATRGELAAFATLVDRQEPLVANYYSGRFLPVIARELFLALYLPASKSLEVVLESPVLRPQLPDEAYFAAYGTDVPHTALRRVAPDQARAYLDGTFRWAVAAVIPLGAGPLEFVAAAHRTLPPAVLASAAEYLALRGEPAAAKALVEHRDEPEARAACAFVALTEGALTDAREHARVALELTRAKSSKKRSPMAKSPAPSARHAVDRHRGVSSLR